MVDRVRSSRTVHSVAGMFLKKKGLSGAAAEKLLKSFVHCGEVSYCIPYRDGYQALAKPTDL